MKDDSNQGLRSQQRAKRKKTNLILNGLIGLVILLIIIVSVSIFGKDDEKTDKKVDQSVEESKLKEKVSAKDSGSDEESIQDEKPVESSEEKPPAESEPVITDGGGENVKRIIVNPTWKPIGTSQTGEHSAVYSQNSIDWQEMTAAMSYATGVEENNMIIWYLGNNGPNQSIGTISTKDKLETYRVYLEWQDNAGWVPQRVEELFHNDKAQ